MSIQLIQDGIVLVTGNFNQFTDERKGIIKVFNFYFNIKYLFQPVTTDKIIQKFGGKWDYEKKGWRCHMSQYQSLKTSLEQTNIEIQGTPEFVLSALNPLRNKLVFKDDKNINEILYTVQDQNKTIESELEPQVINNLYDFQKQGIQFGLQANGRVLIADEMGVGKTIQAICLASCYKSAWPLLIICPSSLKYNWKEEVIKWVRPLRDNQVQILAKYADEIYMSTKVLICSYDIVPKIVDKILRFKTNIVIADEAHYLKNSLAKRTNILVPILQKIKHVILLTGTPAFARPKELFTLLSIIRPDIFKGFKQFGDRFCNPKPSKYGSGTDYAGSSNEKELNYMLKKQIMIRRLKQDVLTQLPKKRRKKVHVNVDQKILHQIQEILNQTKKSSLEQLFDVAIEQNEMNQHKPKQGISFYSALTQCYQLSGQAKLQELKNYIKDLLENDIKIIVFAHHQDMMNQLEAFVANDLKLNFIRIDGQVDPKQRFDRVQKFQNDQSVKVALLSLAAASTGLTLTASSNIVFAEMNWTPAIMQQAEDRAHRIGQVNSVLCHYIVGEKTLDDMLYRKIEQKIAIVSNILDGEQKNLKIDQIQNAQGEIKIFSGNSSKNNNEAEAENEEIENSVDINQIEIKQNYSNLLKNQTQIESYFYKKHLQKQNQIEISQGENYENVYRFDQSIEEDKINVQQDNINQISKCDSSETDSDSEELFALKLIAQIEAKKLKSIDIEKSKQNNQNNIFQVPISKNLYNHKQSTILNDNSSSKQDNNIKLLAINQCNQIENNLLGSNDSQVYSNMESSDENKYEIQNEITIQKSKQENIDQLHLFSYQNNSKSKQNNSTNTNFTPSKSMHYKQNQINNFKFKINSINDLKLSGYNRNKGITKDEEEFLFDSQSSNFDNSNFATLNKKHSFSKQPMSSHSLNRINRSNSNQSFSFEINNSQSQQNRNQNEQNQTTIKIDKYQNDSLINNNDKSIRVSTGFDFLDDAIDELENINDNQKNKNSSIYKNESLVNNNFQNQKNSVFKINSQDDNNKIHNQMNNIFEMSSQRMQGNQMNLNYQKNKIITDFDFQENETDVQKQFKENENKQLNTLFETQNKFKNNDYPQIPKHLSTVKIVQNDIEKQRHNKQFKLDSLQQYVFSDQKQIQSPYNKQYLYTPLQKQKINSDQIYSQSIMKINSNDKEESGLSKITFDNVNEKYIQDSQEELYEQNYIINFNKQNFFNEDKLKGIDTIQSDNNMSKEDDEYYTEEQFNHSQIKCKLNKLKQPIRQIRSRKDFESDYHQNNKLNNIDNNILEQSQPLKQDLNKKFFYKKPSQHY